MTPQKPIQIKQTESEIRAAIKEYLQWTGWFVFYNLQGLGCWPGLSDLVAVKDGQTVYIEVKTFTGKQRPDQIKFQADVEAHGGTYIVARGVEDVEHLNEKKQREGYARTLAETMAERGYEPVPKELESAAKKKLAGKDEAYVSLTSGGKLSKWAAEQRKAKRKMQKESRRRNR